MHTYNATQSTVTGYSPHYLMFGHRPRLLVNFVFPTILNVIKFTIPFTTVVPNGEITTSLIEQILPFTPLRSSSGTSRPFTVFLLETTMLRCPSSQFLKPANILFWHSHNQMIYDLGAFLHQDSVSIFMM